MKGRNSVGYDKTVIRVAARKNKELMELAQSLREFVMEGKVETYVLDHTSVNHRKTTKEHLKVTGMTEGEAWKCIHEAERLELLALLTLESVSL